MIDSMVIANEVIHEAKRTKTPTFVFKEEFKKAYNTERWDFLYWMLGKLGFCNK